MSRLAPAMPGAGAAVGARAKEEDESLLTVAEKGLKRVYDLLREQVGVCVCMYGNWIPGDQCLPCSAPSGLNERAYVWGALLPAVTNHHPSQPSTNSGRRPPRAEASGAPVQGGGRKGTYRRVHAYARVWMGCGLGACEPSLCARGQPTKSTDPVI